ncbi:50S ribosomal protein L33 [Patescibacteria group bacterium]
MAKDARAVIDLSCTECDRINYQSTKNIKPETGKNIPLKLNKFCKWCKKHAEHKELK